MNARRGMKGREYLMEGNDSCTHSREAINVNRNCIYTLHVSMPAAQTAQTRVAGTSPKAKKSQEKRSITRKIEEQQKTSPYGTFPYVTLKCVQPFVSARLLSTHLFSQPPRLAHYYRFQRHHAPPRLSFCPAECPALVQNDSCP